MTEPFQDPAEERDIDIPDNPHYDDIDVPAAIVQKTDDGKGGAAVPKSDFESYTDPEADREDNN